jgi:hypothetical protein
MELWYALLVAEGFWALAEFLLWRERPPGGKQLFQWVLLPLLLLIFLAQVISPIDPEAFAIAFAVVGAFALVFATK